MIRLIIGDCRQRLAELPDESVHCVVTSPPYFGLRDYGTASWEGGDPVCEHVGRRSVGASTLKNDGRPNPGILDGHKVPGVPYRGTCPDCGAIRADKQIGLESTPDAFVAVMVDVFREVRRVLRKDGTLFLNLGDSYAGGGGFSPDSPSNVNGSKQTTHKGSIKGAIGVPSGLKAKDLIGIPWRVAFALQADGWYLRQDIIWAKPNPMPESVTDRCTKAHEYLFLLSKSPRYHYDAEAIAEETTTEPGATWEARKAAGAVAGNIGVSGFYQRAVHGDGSAGSNLTRQDGKRNRRSVWTVATQPFKEAHFATFPPDLIEPCILAGCPKGGVVLDPFGGAGTTGLVADRLQRDAILIELNPDYCTLASNRITDDAPLFTTVEQ